MRTHLYAEGKNHIKWVVGLVRSNDFRPPPAFYYIETQRELHENKNDWNFLKSHTCQVCVLYTYLNIFLRLNARWWDPLSNEISFVFCWQNKRFIITLFSVSLHTQTLARTPTNNQIGIIIFYCAQSFFSHNFNSSDFSLPSPKVKLLTSWRVQWRQLWSFPSFLFHFFYSQTWKEIAEINYFISVLLRCSFLSIFEELTIKSCK